jgi:CheY-like chemotaxis protein
MILVVDDHKESAKILVRLLRMDGYEADHAECAGHALDVMKQRKPALVLLDCHMPEFDGFMLLGRLKAEPGLADVPVVMFSAGNEADRDRAVRLGARDFIKKGSLDWAHIFDVVKRFVPQNGARLWGGE